MSDQASSRGIASEMDLHRAAVHVTGVANRAWPQLTGGYLNGGDLLDGPLQPDMKLCRQTTGLAMRYAVSEDERLTVREAYNILANHHAAIYRGSSLDDLRKSGRFYR